MPRQPRSKRSAFRRKGRARRSKATALSNVNRSLQPIANRYVCKQKYGTFITTSALSGQYVFNLNSVFDPDRTGVGHQPMGFDQLAGLYNKYRVIACGWRIQLPLSSGANAYSVGCLPSNDPSIVWNDFGEMTEVSRTKYITQNSGAPAATLSGKIYLPTLFGKTKASYMADDTLAAQVSTSPSELMLLYLQTFSTGTGLATGGINLQVLLEYTVEYFDPKRLLQS